MLIKLNLIQILAIFNISQYFMAKLENLLLMILNLNCQRQHWEQYN